MNVEKAVGSINNHQFSEKKESHKEKIDAPLRSGFPKRYRGKHRSHVKGAGMMAFLRNSWMRRYKRVYGKGNKNKGQGKFFDQRFH